MRERSAIAKTLFHTLFRPVVAMATTSRSLMCMTPKDAAASAPRRGTSTMNQFAGKRSCWDTRRGTTVVETALVLPVFLLFVLGLVELGHVLMVKNVLRGACREAARLGSTEGNSTADVQELVLNHLGSCIDTSAVDVFVKNAGVYDEGGAPPNSGSDLEALPDIELSDAESRTLFLVRAKINYNDVAVIPLSIPYLGYYLDNLVLNGQAFMRRE
jgi:hypothetical protein